ncbi:hypothetical protein BT67DRAFT_227320 [Trichocladium antarcticum]|uniref:Uncharacterized protein n=1 Tax=Trichocladium antarcticum TaxID=1450529 RepID=A0AAN6Z9S0_9PEZI|nr:hypothetical protein BT67DRAFT_227320 [Trichocladium antarcticum]
MSDTLTPSPHSPIAYRNHALPIYMSWPPLFPGQTPPVGGKARRHARGAMYVLQTAQQQRNTIELAVRSLFSLMDGIGWDGMGFVSATGVVGVAGPAEERNTTTGAAHDMRAGGEKAAADHDHDLMPTARLPPVSESRSLCGWQQPAPPHPPAHLPTCWIQQTVDTAPHRDDCVRVHNLSCSATRRGQCRIVCRWAQRVFRTAVCSVESRG